MSFFSDLGNVFHSIGHFITGHENTTNNQPHPPVVVTSNQAGRAAAPTYNNQNNAPQQNNNQQSPQKQQPLGPSINLYQGSQHTPTAGNYDPSAPLVKANPNPNDPNLPFNQHVQQVNANAATAPHNTADRVVNTLADSVARSAVGIPQGIGQLYDLLTPGKGSNRLTKATDRMGKSIDQDQQTEGLNTRVGNDLYHGAQIAENVVPGVVGAAAKASDAIKAGAKIGDLVKAAPTAVTATVSKVGDTMANIGAQFDHAMGVVGDEAGTLNKAGTATDTKVAAGVQAPDEVATGLKSVNPNQGADALQAIQQKETEQAAQTAAMQPPAPAAPATPPAAAPERTPVPEAPTEQPTIPTSSNTAPNAPNVRAQAEKDLETASNGINIGKAKEHDVLDNAGLNDAANRYVQSMSDEELVANTKDGMTVNNAGDIAKAYATVKRLGKLAQAGNEDAKAAIPKVLDAVEKATSEGGRSLNYVGSMLDSMPKEAQEEYLIKRINGVRSKNGLDPLSDEEEAKARGNLQTYLTEIEGKKDAVSAAKGELDSIMSRATSGDASVDEVKQIQQLQQQIADGSREINQLNTEVGREYAGIVGAKGNWGRSSGEIARSLMLTKVTGRVSDIATTGINAAHTLIQNGLESGIGKVLNKVTGKPGKFVDSMPSARAAVQGTKQGGRALADSYKGNIETPDLYSAIKGENKTGKAQMLTPYTGTKAGRIIRQTGHAMAETATNLTEGLANVHIQQLAEQEGKQLGLTGDDLKVYAAGRAANPTPAMRAAGQRLVDEANNMNDNPLSKMMAEIANSPTMKKMTSQLEETHGGKLAESVGEAVRNIVAPFTHWAATAAWNGATDKNAVANAVKIVQALRKGDPQEVVHQVAGLITNTGVALTTGYTLANSGVLTTHNSEGYNDEGLYLHLGGHYVPVGFLGFFAPGIVMGWATHQAMTDPNGGSVMSKIGHATQQALAATLRSDLNNSIVGGNNQVVKQLQDWLQNKNGIQGGDVLATAGAEAAGNYIPGALGDVNTGLNLTPLNPTHEESLTKVTKGESGQVTKTGAPSTARDIPRTDVNEVLNKVPGVSQKLFPRQPGVAAKDFGSAIVRGDNESADQAEENKAIAQLPPKQQQDVRSTLRKTNGSAQIVAQKTADAMPVGPMKDKAQLAADKLQATAGNGTLDSALGKAKASEDKAVFESSNKEMQTINGKTYTNYKGKDLGTFGDPQKAQQALDFAKFKDSGKTEQHVNGMVYQKGSNGKFTQMEQKDYDYKNANDAITSAKNSGDITGYTKHTGDLLDNISWQLNHADLTQSQRDQLTQKAVQMQEEYAKTQQYGGFTKPKGADTFSTPQIANAKDGYVKAIQEAGAKYGVDINALMSVAAQEGLGGGVGDNGTSFGPFQLHEGGALPQGKDQKWAESPEGIDYAIRTIKSIVGNKTGEDAIKAIVSEFERSADQPTEIANAIALYHGGKATLTPGASGGSGVSVDTAGSGSSNAASLLRENKIGALPIMARESFINNMMKPDNLYLPQIKRTDPETLIKAHKITVGMPKA